MSAAPVLSAEDGTPVQENQYLLDIVNSPDFTLYDCIRLIHKHSDNIGIHHFLCQKLLLFSHAELQFYIPQLVQILLTVETESMALEELLIKLRGENPHFALLTFWQLQALLTDLSTDPESYGFQVARRVLNDQQYALFSTSLHDKNDDDDEEVVEKTRSVSTNIHIQSRRKNKMNENIPPSIIYTSMMAASIASPQLAEITQPLVVSQGKRQKAYVFKLAKSAMKDFRRNLNLKTSLKHSQKSKHSKNKSAKLQRDVTPITPNSPKVDIVPPATFEDQLFKKQKEFEIDLDFDIVDNVGERVFENRISSSIKLPKRKSKYIDDSFVHRPHTSTTLTKNTKTINSETNLKTLNELNSTSDDNEDSNDSVFISPAKKRIANLENFTNSMPDLHDIQSNTNDASPAFIPDYKQSRMPLKHSSTTNLQKLNTKNKAGSKPPIKEVDISSLSTTKKIKLLKTNYFKYETQFAIALETISQRLSQVPTEARLSALRAELSLLNRDLPAEVDIPTLLPPNKKGKLHKLCTITASEAQVLNSAEKVPYLLLIEYLRNEFDFDPTSEENESILENKCKQSSSSFDLNIIGKGDPSAGVIILEPKESTNDSETVDTNARTVSQMSELSITGSTNSDPTLVAMKEVDLSDMSMIRVRNQTDAEVYRESLVLRNTAKIPTLPKSSEERNPELNFAMNFDEIVDQDSKNKPDQYSQTNELADQMRISALMLAQLDKSPQELSDAANQIRAKIIASMKEGQDKFGYKDLEGINGMAGERKLENDLMTGGIDTSYLGEDWVTKKERIRKTSEFGHLENWDLCSVIAKSGDDLRQEAFACQIILAMAQIWTKEKVDVWVKKMKILITSANTGLVETITNAVSVHSIKKSLTKKMIDDKELDEKGGIASLLDHFLKAFGDPSGFKFKRAQDNFASSLAAYSVICYLLQIKDRHNGNIMIDNEGHVCHIDFGFMLSNSPGSVGFESAPFKFTYEYAEVLGGVESEAYLKFVRLVKESFKALRHYADQIVSMCEIMQKDNMQPCFNAGDQTSVQLKQRFHLELSDAECDDFVENVLVAKSLGNIYTRLYDQFQLITQGIYL